MFFSSKIEEKLQFTQERYIRAWDEYAEPVSSVHESYTPQDD